MVFKKIEPHRMVFQPWVSHSACWISPNTMIWGISYFSPLMVRMSGSFLVSPGHFFPHFSCFAALSRRLIPFVQGNVNTFRHINTLGPLVSSCTIFFRVQAYIEQSVLKIHDFLSAVFWVQCSSLSCREPAPFSKMNRETSHFCFLFLESCYYSFLYSR